MHLVQIPIVLGLGVRVWDGLEALQMRTTSRRSPHRAAYPSYVHTERRLRGVDAKRAALILLIVDVPDWHDERPGGGTSCGLLQE